LVAVPPPLTLALSPQRVERVISAADSLPCPNPHPNPLPEGEGITEATSQRERGLLKQPPRGRGDY